MHFLLSALLFCVFFALLLTGLVRVLHDMLTRDVGFIARPAPEPAQAPAPAPPLGPTAEG